ncbi:MAG TPA: FKBP-type peptidyl-prolyl cis-trans isomerase [Steroidobacteraceae bacterium]|nr:FKBP-type peptidyl-prolyl cis-trans isomerase [Steroidobacteraceae bacterium]
MRRILLIAAIAMVVGCNATAAPDVKIETDEQKALYSLGYLISGNIKSFELSDAELAIVKAGLTDGVLKKKAQIDPQSYVQKLQALQTTRMAAAATRDKAAGEAFIAKAAAEKGATKLPSGMVITTIKEGTGESPVAADTVKVHYHGTLVSGDVFDSSVQRGQPIDFPLNGVIPCWTEGVQKIKVGGKAKLICPSNLAYGDQGRPPTIPPGATLIFEVELLEIVKSK